MSYIMNTKMKTLIAILASTFAVTLANAQGHMPDTITTTTDTKAMITTKSRLLTEVASLIQ